LLASIVILFFFSIIFRHQKLHFLTSLQIFQIEEGVELVNAPLNRILLEKELWRDVVKRVKNVEGSRESGEEQGKTTKNKRIIVTSSDSSQVLPNKRLGDMDKQVDELRHEMRNSHETTLMD
jgi:hypothetical protein